MAHTKNNFGQYIEVNNKSTTTMMPEATNATHKNKINQPSELTEVKGMGECQILQQKAHSIGAI